MGDLEDDPTDSEYLFDVMVVGSTAETYLRAGANLLPGAALAAGFNTKLRNVQKLASNRMVLIPMVASSQGGFHEAWLLLYEKLAERWQNGAEGRDGRDVQDACAARWLADASTTLQRTQFALIMALARSCLRVDPDTGVTPQAWQPFEVMDVFPYLPGGAR